MTVAKALRDISRRPEPDVTGAIQHVCAAMQATARDLPAGAVTIMEALIRTPSGVIDSGVASTHRSPVLHVLFQPRPTRA